MLLFSINLEKSEKWPLISNMNAQIAAEEMFEINDPTYNSNTHTGFMN